MADQPQRRQATLPSAIKPSTHSPGYGFAKIERQEILGLNKVADAFLNAKLKRTFRRIRRTWDSALPANIRGLTGDELRAVVSLSQRPGWCLVWTPRRPLVREIVAARSAQEQGSIIVRRRRAILNDLSSGLGDASSAEAEFVDGAAEAIDAAGAGHVRASQALTAALLTSLLHDHFDHQSLNEARKEFEKNDPSTGYLSHFPLAVVCRAYAVSLTRLAQQSPSTPTVTFNRSRTVHQASWPSTFTHLNCVTGLMLLVGVLRALDHWPTADG